MSNSTDYQATLLAQINAANTKQWAEGQLVFGLPTADSTGAKNTVVVVTPVPGQPFTGSRSIFFDRVGLNEIPDGGAAVELELTDEATTHDVVNLLAAEYNVALSVDDVQEAPLGEADEFGTIVVVLQAAVGSGMWHGSLEVTLKPASQTMDQAIPENEVDGFNRSDVATG